MTQCGLTPGHGHGVDIEVGFTQRLHAAGTQFGQTCIQLAGDAAEIGVAAVTQAEYGELQLRQPGCALAAEEFGEADCVVRRIALALGADHQVQQALAGQFAGGVGVGAGQAHGQAGGLGAGGDLLRFAAGIAGLAAVQHGQALAGLRRRQRGRAPRQDRQLRGAVALGQAGGVAGQPPQGRPVQALHQPGQQDLAILVEWTGAGHDGCGVHPGRAWRGIGT